ncbi:MAG: EAL domain-containing protein, partial [Phycisphaerae bacterium]|nr:EAL domain-containing protein [Phycisphaerae bacterium]NIP54103.1 EAL domain-containing protein [Phycisphaerae bacterium]NIU10506.1 EAL domain-containing protein [Phycisphaerae bacterium]NIX00493.1 EAL domain-containing protein [Phycisphaerae bacterium]NIX30120.1 EAL domain-containing protein [Phycisphaerae bacterium]
EVQSFEALLRWRHPQRGLLYPDDFISIAERTGLIVPIGWWVIEEACKQISYWQNVIQSALPLSISVNVSGKHFIDDEIELRLSQMIRQWRIN